MRYSVLVIDAQIDGRLPFQDRLIDELQLRLRPITRRQLLRNLQPTDTMRRLVPKQHVRVFRIQVRNARGRTLRDLHVWLHPDGRMECPRRNPTDKPLHLASPF